MEDLKKLSEEGNFSKTLLEDKKFCEEIKEILKREKPDATDEDVVNIIKMFEQEIKNDKTLSDSELEGVSGGISDRLAITAYSVDKFRKIGAVVGALTFGGISYGGAHICNNGKDTMHSANIEGTAAVAGGVVGGAVGMAAGAAIGEKVAEKIYKRFSRKYND